jgi:hypothetical protein
MIFTRNFHVLLLAFAACFLSALPAQTAPGSTASAATEPPAPSAPSPTAVYPQIVRIRTVEGDVRVARSQDKSGPVWETAVSGLPLATGFTLATGNGRAEIEFEDASTVYLADNSLLALDTLRTAGGIPATEMTLIAGTVTLHVRPASGESFALKTPTDGLSVAYPNKAYLRVTSYTDAIAITPQKDESYQLDAAATPDQKAVKGQTEYYNDGQLVPSPAASDGVDYAAWDSWVANRVAQRSAAMTAVMKASGLTQPQPGLADMAGQGVFFKCAPYGTCWDPPGDPDTPQTTGAPLPAVGQPDFALALSASKVSMPAGSTVAVKLSLTGLNGFQEAADVEPSLPYGFSCTSCGGPLGAGQTMPIELTAGVGLGEGIYTIPFTATTGPITHEIVLEVYIYTVAPPDLTLLPPAAMIGSPIYPCFPGAIRALALPSVHIAPHTVLVMTPAPYAWTVCHLGTWIYRQNHYVWVVGPRRHHHPPYRWVKDKHATGYVPGHPRDVAGKPPVNRKHDVYAVNGKKSDSVERMQFDANAKIEELKQPPKEFRNPSLPPLAPSSEPPVLARSTRAPKEGIPVSMDPQSRQFVMRDARGGPSVPVFRQLAGRSRGLNTGTHNNVVPRGGMRTPHTTHTAGAGRGGAAHTGGHSGGTHAGGTHAGGGHAGGGHAGGGHGGGGGGHSGGGHH